MTGRLGEPFAPVEPEWLLRAQAGLAPIRKTSDLPTIIPPVPRGDTTDLKVWKEYWLQHDNEIRRKEREQVLDELRESLSHIRFQEEDMWFIEAVISKIESLRQQEQP